MDWQGQKLAEQLMEILLLIFAVAAFSVGYLMGSYQTMIEIYATGYLVIVFILVFLYEFLCCVFALLSD